eukprot:CAMPEP_0204563724 /NCGR_PEP_ID=MMETSP0661-20131031/34487_1 /ASSEMBLY_ACC=CAM_ASM_000606 /TAXON_ID=109239 /ORGANISM="Alexandrium margalefi, Strain AMGDE01CS-322" /LENGTH=55 /DNA_ID=CAMNT_0051571313 /DNA_START=152 /DNA_END=316 /DNA_ORIENTATION=-
MAARAAFPRRRSRQSPKRSRALCRGGGAVRLPVRVRLRNHLLDVKTCRPEDAACL